jgi:hypothetical protein
MNIFALCHAQIYCFSPQAAGNLPKEIKCEQYNLKGIFMASPEIKKLLQIINDRVPDKYELYY